MKLIYGDYLQTKQKEKEEKTWLFEAVSDKRRQENSAK